MPQEKMASQRKFDQLRRQRIHRRYLLLNAINNSPINNGATLGRIVNLPQQTTNDLQTFEFFNGFPFY